MIRLLEKEFQVWRVAAQSEHDSLEDTCTELKTMMEALNQHNQHLEEEVDRVRHVSGVSPKISGTKTKIFPSDLT